METEIIIEPPKIIKEEGFPVDNQCLHNHFSSLIIGKPGSGKSHLISQLLLN